jgi:mono/diheme cytochrome c family protein
MASRTTQKFTERLPAIIVGSIILLGVVVTAGRFISFGGNGASIPVEVPELSQLAARGRAAFDANCVACHGTNAGGSEKGPPLAHDIYNPGHHPDAAFLSAAKRGVSQHHWRFGNMPPLPQVSDEEVAAIVRYVRELQEANGIFYRPHDM